MSKIKEYVENIINENLQILKKYSKNPENISDESLKKIEEVIPLAIKYNCCEALEQIAEFDGVLMLSYNKKLTEKGIIIKSSKYEKYKSNLKKNVLNKIGNGDLDTIDIMHLFHFIIIVPELKGEIRTVYQGLSEGEKKKNFESFIEKMDQSNVASKSGLELYL